MRVFNIDFEAYITAEIEKATKAVSDQPVSMSNLIFPAEAVKGDQVIIHFPSPEPPIVFEKEIDEGWKRLYER